jgi:tetratricopeptide (TPR) repeat protein
MSLARGVNNMSRQQRRKTYELNKLERGTTLSLRRLYTTLNIPRWLSASVIGTIFVFLSLTTYAFFNPTPTLEIEDVPKSLEEDGYTSNFYSQCIENRLLDQMNDVRNASDDRQPSQNRSPPPRIAAPKIPTRSGRLAPTDAATDAAPTGMQVEYSSMKTTGLLTDDSPIIHPVTFLDIQVAPYSVASWFRRSLGLDSMRNAQVQVTILKQDRGLMADVDIVHAEVSHQHLATTGGSYDLCKKIGDYIAEILFPRRYALFLSNDGQEEHAEALLTYLINTGDSEIARDHAALGNVYLRERRFDDAQEEYEKAVSMHLNAAWIDLANTDLGRGNFNQSIILGNQHLKDGNDAVDQAILLNNIAVAKEQLHDQDGAVQEFMQSIQADKKYPLGYVNLCHHFLNTRKLEAARTNCAIASRLDPSNRSTLNELEAFYKADSHSHDAFIAFLRRPETNKDDATLDWVLWIQNIAGVNAADRELLMDQDELPQPGAPEYMKGRLEFARDDFQNAERSFEDAAALGYSTELSYKMAASASDLLNDGQVSRFVHQEAKNEPNDAQRVYLLAQAASFDHDWATMNSLMLKAADDGLDSAEFHDTWGRMLERSELYSLADEQYVEAIRKDPYMAIAYMDHGDMLRLKLDWPAAALQYAQARSLRPWDVSVISESIYATWKIAGGSNNPKETADAIAQLDATLQNPDQENSKSDQSNGWLRKGEIYLETKQYENASIAFTHCVKTFRSHAGCWNNLGYAIENMLGPQKYGSSAMDDAAADYARAVTLDATNSAGQSNITRAINHPEWFGTTWCRQPGLFEALSTFDQKLTAQARQLCRHD